MSSQDTLQNNHFNPITQVFQLILSLSSVYFSKLANIFYVKKLNILNQVIDLQHSLLLNEHVKVNIAVIPHYCKVTEWKGRTFV